MGSDISDNTEVQNLTPQGEYFAHHLHYKFDRVFIFRLCNNPFKDILGNRLPKRSVNAIKYIKGTVISLLFMVFV